MKRKIISAFFLAVALLMVGTILAAAQGSGRDTYQMDMSTPTPTLVPASTPLSGDLPLSGAQTAAQSGTCPMMSGMDMTGTGMSGMQGMSGMNMGSMSGMNMGNMSGMQGTSGMNMGGMAGMNMNTMNGPMYSTPWYNNPWLMLGWVLLVVVFLALLAGIVLTFQRITRRSKAVAPTEIS